MSFQIPLALEAEASGGLLVAGLYSGSYDFSTGAVQAAESIGLVLAYDSEGAARWALPARHRAHSGIAERARNQRGCLLQKVSGPPSPPAKLR